MNKIKGFFRFVYALNVVLGHGIGSTFANMFKDGNGLTFLRKRIYPNGMKLIKNTGSSLTIHGAENVPSGENFLFVGNHRSYTDILVLFVAGQYVNCPVSFMSKKEIFKTPFLGGALKFLRTIKVDRSSTKSAVKSIVDSVEALKDGVNLVIFPEGTRSNDGHTLSQFKKGAFTIAKKAGVRMVPFVIEGTEKYMPKGEFAMYPAELSIKFFPPVSTADRSDTDIMNEVEALIKKELNQA